jgi:hypothetical protein
MDWPLLFWAIGLGLVGLYAVGRLLVAAYFRAKLAYVELVAKKLEGETKDAEA